MQQAPRRLFSVYNKLRSIDLTTNQVFDLPYWLCEICVTECCAVVQSTAIAMGVPPVSINNINHLQTK